MRRWSMSSADVQTLDKVASTALEELKKARNTKYTVSFCICVYIYMFILCLFVFVFMYVRVFCVSLCGVCSIHFFQMRRWRRLWLQGADCLRRPGTPSTPKEAGSSSAWCWTASSPRFTLVSSLYCTQYFFFVVMCNRGKAEQLLAFSVLPLSQENGDSAILPSDRYLSLHIMTIYRNLSTNTSNNQFERI